MSVKHKIFKEEITSASDSDSLIDFIYDYTSPTSSVGRSSTGSIPWAEDAIRQNQLEWERIERIFYGEEDLPSDPKTREEFLEWMNAFPHLRIVGKQMEINYYQELEPSDENYEEIFAIDPPTEKSRRKHFTVPDHHDAFYILKSTDSHKNESPLLKVPQETRSGHILSRRRFMPNDNSSSASALTSHKNTNKYFTITTDPLNIGSLTTREGSHLNQNHQTYYQQLHKSATLPLPRNHLTSKLKQLDIKKIEPNIRTPTSGRNDSFFTSRRYNLVATKSSTNLSLKPSAVKHPTYQTVSASNVRMPPILNLKLIYNQSDINSPIKSTITNKKQELQPTITLPAIEGKSTNFVTKIVGRSISAVNGKKVVLNNVSFSAPKKKLVVD